METINEIKHNTFITHMCHPASDCHATKAADLDAKQFASEQAAKEQSAQTKETDRALELDAQDHKHGKFIHDWLIISGRDKSNKPLKKLAKLPNTALALITEFHYGEPAKIKDFARKMIFINKNMEKLLPAIIVRNHQSIYFNTIFQHIDLAHEKLGCPSGMLHYWLSKYVWTPQGATIGLDIQFTYPQELPEPILPRSFIAYWQTQGIVYKVFSGDLKKLKALSHEQLQYLATIYDKRTQALENYRKSLTEEQRRNGPQTIQSIPQASTITLTPEELAIHDSLPESIGIPVKFNYTFTQPQEEEEEEDASDEEQA